MCLCFTSVGFKNIYRFYLWCVTFTMHSDVKLWPRYTNFHILFQSIHLATRQMIHTYSAATGLHYLELNWNHPRFLPQRYQLKYMCTMKNMYKYKNVNENYYLEGTKNLTSNTTSARISNVYPGSICTIFLLAVYNPASIDSGIEITKGTLREYISKRNSGLNDFIITLGYCLCLQVYIQSLSKPGQNNKAYKRNSSIIKMNQDLPLKEGSILFTFNLYMYMRMCCNAGNLFELKFLCML